MYYNVVDHLEFLVLHSNNATSMYILFIALEIAFTISLNIFFSHNVSTYVRDKRVLTVDNVKEMGKIKTLQTTESV